MAEEKFASLSSGLLARKGAAKPAMRRQAFINPQGDVASDEDLGWNDMGHDVTNPFGVPVQPVEADAETPFDAPEPEVRKQLDQLSENLENRRENSNFETIESKPMPVIAHAAVSAQPAEPKRAEPGSRKILARDKIAFTLRLDKDRHLKLRLASAVSNRSAQQIVTEALDNFLDTMSGLSTLAEHAPLGRHNRND